MKTKKINNKYIFQTLQSRNVFSIPSFWPGSACLLRLQIHVLQAKILLGSGQATLHPMSKYIIEPDIW